MATSRLVEITANEVESSYAGIEVPGRHADQPGLCCGSENQSKERYQGGFEITAGQHRRNDRQVVESLSQCPGHRQANGVGLVEDVAIGEQDPVSPRLPGSLPHRVIFSQPFGGQFVDVHGSRPRVCCCKPVNFLSRGVLGPIVDGDQLEIRIVGCEQGRETAGNPIAFVLGGNHHCHLWQDLRSLCSPGQFRETPPPQSQQWQSHADAPQPTEGPSQGCQREVHEGIVTKRRVYWRWERSPMRPKSLRESRNEPSLNMDLGGGCGLGVVSGRGTGRSGSRVSVAGTSQRAAHRAADSVAGDGERDR